MDKTIMITGATSGIGEATAYAFAEHGNRIIITGRRLERLEEIEKDIINRFGVTVKKLHFDVRNREEVERSIASLSDDWKNIDVLVNNAGLAVGLNTIQDGLYEDWDRMIDTNIKGLLYVSRSVMPLMVKRNSGHIINIGSIAGKETYANNNAYCATKFAVDSLTKTMRIDLLPHNIKVTAVHPGAVETEFSIVRYKGDKEKADNTYKGYTPLSAMDVAETIVFTATRPAHVNINDIVIMPTAQASPYHFNKEL